MRQLQLDDAQNLMKKKICIVLQSPAREEQSPITQYRLVYLSPEKLKNIQYSYVISVNIRDRSGRNSK